MPSRLTNIDMNLLVPLQALLRERSVTRAAVHIGITQPAMSNALRRIRSLLEDEILVRSRSGYQLTPRAEAIRDAVDDAINTVSDRILLKPQFDPALSTRRFRIAASGSTVFTALRPVIQRSSASNPRLTFVLGDLARSVDGMLEQPELDLVLIPDVLPTEHTRERLYEESWVLVVSADNSLIGERATVSDLMSLPHAVYEADGLRTHAELALASLGDRRPAVVTTSDFIMLFHLIAGSTMIGSVQGSVARRLGQSFGLRIVEPPIPLARFGIDAVRNPARAGDPALDWLVSELRAETATGGL